MEILRLCMEWMLALGWISMLLAAIAFLALILLTVYFFRQVWHKARV